MTKIRIALLGLIVSLAICVTALAAEKKFTSFTIDVPASCQSQEDPDSGIVMVNCGDVSFFAIQLITEDAGGMTAQEIAEQAAKETGGSKPILNENKNYEFDTVQNGISMKAEIITDGKIVMLQLVDNSSVEWPKALSKAFDSIEANTPALQAFLDKNFWTEDE